MRHTPRECRAPIAVGCAAIAVLIRCRHGVETVVARSYADRLNRVFDYVDQNLGEDLTLEGLADVACLSKFHFGRVFQACTGETLFQFIRRLRLERAASLLLARPSEPVTGIGLACGFDNPSAFTRSFRGHFGVSPTGWRNGNRCSSPGYERPNQTLMIRDQLVSEPTVAVIPLPETPVAYVRHVGPFAADPDLFERLYTRLFRWATPRGLVDYPLVTFCIYHDSPGITSDEQLRLSVGLPIPSSVETAGEVGRLCLAGGTYAVATVELGPAEFAAAWTWVLGRWLPESGYEPDDRPAFERYTAPTEAAMHSERQLIDICVPVRPADV